MKLLSVVIFLMSLQVQAAPNLGPNDIYIAGDVVSVEPLCPTGMKCIVGGSIIHLKFTLPSPCYNLSQLSYAVSNEGKNVEVTAVQTDNSANLICTTVLVEELKSISLVDVYPPFDLLFTGSNSLAFPIKITGFEK
jgi:hypothetical protein